MQSFATIPARAFRSSRRWPVGIGFVLAFLLLGSLGDQAVRPVGAAEETYVVERGDTLAGIAENFGVSAATIIEANGIEDPDVLYIGQILIIPTDDAAPTRLTGASHVTVQPDQSLVEIAISHGVTVQEIIELNDIADGDLIVPGQVLTLPEGRSVPRTSSRGAQDPLPPTPTPEPPPAPEPPPTPATTRPQGWTVQWKVTMYCLQGRMANGSFVQPGAAAADASILPLGARVYLEGMGTYTIMDRFAVNQGTYRLDLWEPSCARAIQWGVRYLTGTVLS
ncbi:MAG TPA: LysM peptidoglycan-binding domain-containing protein [Dehalococcoidia bacterium]|nr:LysM peptidoglycan-binding domain-containing protein [Dehalococcoidia bacterium]